MKVNWFQGALLISIISIGYEFCERLRDQGNEKEDEEKRALAKFGQL